VQPSTPPLHSADPVRKARSRPACILSTGGTETLHLEVEPSSCLAPRFLALDLGAKRIGIAVSDELGLTAQPVLTLEVHRNRRDDLRSIARLARRFAVAGIVVGNPLHLSGEASPRALKTQQFATELGSLTGLPIHLWDERLTTRKAHEILYEAGHPLQDHKQVVDQVAATLILQSFLDTRRTHQSPASNSSS
jgi:putative Holliday junction resolvase